MRKLILILTLFLGVQNVQAQETIWPSHIKQTPILTPYDSVMLCALPELPNSAVLKSSDLPYFLDNSKLPYYRPIYQQVSSECGQVSGIAYNYTYEINRLRDLPASDSANQYPPHFTYNFMNGGNGWFGVSYFHCFEILKALGCPSVETYGGMSAGGDSRWMTGYDNYLGAMSNRIREMYQISVGTEEGLMNLKQWLHNHMDGSDIGGVASFYANAPWNMHTLPEGTPDGGKKVIVYWAGDPSHAMTIAGYNDSIRYDYNEDGLYTNHLDITADGKVDMSDWEIGGLIFADGWQSGINFGDSGKCYMMYKTLADKLYEGGIWNNAVHVLDVKDLEKPRLTAKVKLKHDRRGMLRIKCGVSSSESDTLPVHMIEFPVFNFQGGNHFMQGGVELEEHKTIEFGLDITPLLGLLEGNNFKQFFLVIEERDPESLGAGFIESFSVIDYSGLYPQEIYCEEHSIPIINNGITYASLIFPDELDIMEVITEELPAAIVGEQYSFNMEKEGGTSPFKWSLLHAVEEDETQDIIDTTGLFVEPDYYHYGNYTLSMPFSFPFYGNEYDTIFISTKGFIMFENTNYQWPYLKDPAQLIRQTKCIAPFLCKYMDIVPAFGHGIWVKEGAEMVSIRWIADLDHYSYSPLIEFGLELYKNGEIKFIYGSDFETHHLSWGCGVSKGDQLNYLIPNIVDRPVILPGEAINILINELPSGMGISEDGIFSGTPLEYYKELDLSFCVEDDDHIRAFKTLKFSSTDLGVNDDMELEDSDLIVYPNPFRQEITIRFANHIHGPVRCVVYSSTGQMMRYIFEGSDIQKGDLIYWDATDQSGNTCPPGLYFLNIQSERQSVVKKLILSAS